MSVKQNVYTRSWTGYEISSGKRAACERLPVPWDCTNCSGSHMIRRPLFQVEVSWSFFVQNLYWSLYTVRFPSFCILYLREIFWGFLKFHHEDDKCSIFRNIGNHQCSVRFIPRKTNLDKRQWDESVRDQNAVESIWTWEGGSTRRLEKVFY